MKSLLCLIAFQLVLFVAADVSHLNNMYLPPHESTQDIEDSNPTASYNAPLPLDFIRDAVVQHMQERFEATTENLNEQTDDAPIIGEEFPAPSQNIDFELPALPEVSNGIDTRYAANGGYVY